MKNPNTTLIPILVKNTLVIFNTWKETARSEIGLINSLIIKFDKKYPNIEKKIIAKIDLMILYLNSSRCSKNGLLTSLFIIY